MMTAKKDRKQIRISNTRLAKIRDEFRKLWFEAYRNRFHKLLEKRSQARLDEEKWKRAHRELNDLKKTSKSSILKCSECGTFSGDRIYVAEDDRWFCIKCYNGPYVPWSDIGDD